MAADSSTNDINFLVITIPLITGSPAFEANRALFFKTLMNPAGDEGWGLSQDYVVKKYKAYVKIQCEWLFSHGLKPHDISHEFFHYFVWSAFCDDSDDWDFPWKDNLVASFENPASPYSLEYKQYCEMHQQA